MVRARRLILGPLLLLTGVAVAGCSAVPMAEDPSGAAFVNRFLAFLANPNVAYLLFVLGLLALIAEFSTPGAVVPGVSGAIMLVLSMYGLLHLPTNWLGPALIILGVAMLLLDLKVTGFALSIGGVISFLIGSLLMFTPPWAAQGAFSQSAVVLNLWLVIVTTVSVAAFVLFAIAAALKAQKWPVAVGRETMIGKTGVAIDTLAPSGTVRVEGEHWSAESARGEEIAAGTSVHIVGLHGLRLQVERDWGAARSDQRAPWPPDASDPSN